MTTEVTHTTPTIDTPTLDTTTAVAFLQWLSPEGPWTVAALPSKATAWGRDLEEVATFAREHAGENVYFTVARCAPGDNGLPDESKAVYVDALYLDIDPPKSGTTAEALRAWQETTLGSLRDDAWWTERQLPPPSAVVYSGSGFQIFWRLTEAYALWTSVDGVDTQSASRVAEVKERLKEIARRCGGDSQVCTVKQVMRLPGTINHPDDRKRKKGRTTPELARVVAIRDDLRYSLDAFSIGADTGDEGDASHSSASPIVAQGALPGFAIDAAVGVLVDAWPATGRADTSLVLAGALLRSGLTDEDAVAIMVKVTGRANGDGGDLAKRKRQVSNTRERLGTNAPVQGWPALASRIGWPAVEAAKRALGVGPEARAVRDAHDFSFMPARQAQTHAVAADPEPTATHAPIDVKAALKARSRYRGDDANHQAEAALCKRVLENDAVLTGRDLGAAVVAAWRAIPANWHAQDPKAVSDQMVALFLTRTPAECHERLDAMIGAGRELAIPTITETPEDGHIVGYTEVAEGFVVKHASRDGVPTIRKWRGGFYQWTPGSGCYREMSNDQLDKTLRLRANQGLSDTKEVKEVRAGLVGVNRVLIDGFDLGSWLENAPGDTEPHDIVTCRNGLLHVPTLQLMPVTPRYFTTTTIGAHYREDAKSPARWLEFIHDIWPDSGVQGSDDAEKTALLQEWLGLMMVPDTRYERTMVLVGPPRSGKGTIMDVMASLLGGPDNVAAPKFSALGSHGNFVLQPLIGKMAAIIGDARSSKRLDIAQVLDTVLSISGRDFQTIDRKNQIPWTGRLSTRFTVGVNPPFDLEDATGALASRLLVLEFSKSFAGREDFNLKDSLRGEIDGIFLWALEGLRRLRARNKFSVPMSSISAVETIALGSPVREWVRECAVLDPALSWRCANTYESYANWCRTNKFEDHDKGPRLFGRELRAAFPSLPDKQRRRENGQYTYHYSGIGMRTAAMEADVTRADVGPN